MQVQKTSSKFDFSLEHQNPTAPPSQNPSSFEEKLGLVFQKLKSTKIKEAFILYNSRNFPFVLQIYSYFFLNKSSIIYLHKPKQMKDR